MDADPLYQDKHGWNLGLRIFDIMLHVDMRKFDLAESMVGNLRRHVQRYADEDSRERNMYRFLNILCRSAFNLEEAVKEGADILAKLSESTHWKAYSHEPVPYDMWIKAKLESKKVYPYMMENLVS